jgi:hypothetical protein
MGSEPIYRVSMSISLYVVCRAIRGAINPPRARPALGRVREGPAVSLVRIHLDRKLRSFRIGRSFVIVEQEMVC